MRLWSLLRSVVRFDSKGEEDMNRTNRRGICALYDRCIGQLFQFMRRQREERGCCLSSHWGLVVSEFWHSNRAGEEGGRRPAIP